MILVALILHLLMKISCSDGRANLQQGSDAQITFCRALQFWTQLHFTDSKKKFADAGQYHLHIAFP